MQKNLFEAAHAKYVARLLFRAFSGSHPEMAQQPISEDSLPTGLLKETNQAYVIVKIARVLQVQSYRR